MKITTFILALALVIPHAAHAADTKPATKPAVTKAATTKTGSAKKYSYDDVITKLAAEMQTGYLKVTFSSDELFDANTSKLSAKAADKLDQLVYLANQSRKGKVVIQSNTDSNGSYIDNGKLSQAQAAAVAKYLEEHGGPTRMHLIAQGYGENFPIAANKNADGSDNPAGRAKNRRVDVYIQTVEGGVLPRPVAAHPVDPPDGAPPVDPKAELKFVP